MCQPPPAAGPDTYPLDVCGVTVTIACDDENASRAVLAVFGGLSTRSAASGSSAIALRISAAGPGRFRVRAPSGDIEVVEDDKLLFTVDKVLTVWLQHARSDLLFLHAAAVGLQGRAAVIPGPGGSGKSTLSLGLLQRGLEYLSDELAPIEPATLRVHPYARALCLKGDPPGPLQVPANALRSGNRLHIPIGRDGEPRDYHLRVIVVPRRGQMPPGTSAPISPARAAAELLGNCLNPLAHPEAGIDAITALCARVPAHEVDCTDVDAASERVMALLRES